MMEKFHHFCVSSICKPVSFSTHLLQTSLSLYSYKFFVFPQKIQLGSYFLKIIEEPSTKIYNVPLR